MNNEEKRGKIKDRSFGYMILYSFLWISTEFFGSSTHFCSYVIPSELWKMYRSFPVSEQLLRLYATENAEESSGNIWQLEKIGEGEMLRE